MTLQSESGSFLLFGEERKGSIGIEGGEGGLTLSRAKF